MSPTVRELEAGLTDYGERIHAAWLTDDCPGGTPYALCQPAAVLNVIGWDPDQVNCTVCIEVLINANRAATAVMETGLPGGHPSQHDADDCVLACACGTVAAHCPRHDLPQHDPAAWPVVAMAEARRAHRDLADHNAEPLCAQLPGCHWPQQEVTA